MKCIGALTTLFLFVATPGTSIAVPELLLHVESGFGDCSALVPDTLECSMFSVEGDSTGYQRIYVLASGVESASALGFGVSYSPGVNVVAWQSCADLALPTSAWPDSGEGVALTWTSLQRPSGSDSLLVAGYFLVAPGSVGLLTVTAPPGQNRASYVDSTQATKRFNPLMSGTVDVAGEGMGFLPCEHAAAPELGDPSLHSLTVVFEQGTVALPSDSTGLIDTYTTYPLNEITFSNAALESTLTVLGVTGLRKVSMVPEGTASHASMIERRIAVADVPQVKAGDPEWNLDRFISGLLASGVDSVAVVEDTLIAIDEAARDYSSAETRMYSVRFVPPVTPQLMKSCLLGFSEVDSVRMSTLFRSFFSGDCSNPFPNEGIASNPYVEIFNESASNGFFCGEGGSWVVPAWQYSTGSSFWPVHLVDTQPQVDHEDYVGYADIPNRYPAADHG